MSDQLDDPPCLGRAWCPECEKTADPSREILDTRYCPDHTQQMTGSADAEVLGEPGYLSGNAEVDAETNRAWCRVIHGR